MRLGICLFLLPATGKPGKNSVEYRPRKSFKTTGIESKEQHTSSPPPEKKELEAPPHVAAQFLGFSPEKAFPYTDA